MPMMGGQPVDQEQLMAKGTQNIDRNEMMNAANLAQAAQNFIQQ